MTSYRYSRWDGAQRPLRLDAEAALAALSEHMMQGLGAREALEWMRRHGFELAGLDTRVRGLSELVQALRERIRELEKRYDMSRALDGIAERLERLLDREQDALRRSAGFESARMSGFGARRIGPHASVSERIERFADWRFEEASAAEHYSELRGELERLRRLEQFLRERGERFEGRERADYDTAQQVREQIERLEAFARSLAEGDLRSVSAEQMREILGESGARCFVLIRDLEQGLTQAGLLRDEELTPRAIRKIGAAALADVYRGLRKGFGGEHATPGRGSATPVPDRRRPWSWGDPLDLDVVETLLRSLRRQAAAGPGGAHAAGRIELGIEDFQLLERDSSSQTTSVMLLDQSWSMSWADRFSAAKRVALAMDQLIRSRYPRDHFAVVGFSTRARALGVRELPGIGWDAGAPFTNLQEGLMLAERVIRRHPCASPQILIITDGQPTAYFAAGELHVEWPTGVGGISPRAVAETLRQVERITRRGITINTFMLDDTPELVGFVERMTRINRGRAFFTTPRQLGSFLMLDYIAHRSLRRSV